MEFSSDNIKICVGIIAAIIGSFQVVRKLAKDLAALKRKYEEQSPNTEAGNSAHLVIVAHFRTE